MQQNSPLLQTGQQRCDYPQARDTLENDLDNVTGVTQGGQRDRTTWHDDSVSRLWLHHEEVLEALGLPVREDDSKLILGVANHGAIKLYQVDLILIRLRFDATHFGQMVGHCFAWFIE